MKVLEEIRTMVGTVAEDEEIEEKDFEDTGDGNEEEETPPQPSPEGREEDFESGEETYDEMNKPNTVDVPETKYDKETRTIDVKVEYTEEEINILAQKVAKLNGEKVGFEYEKAIQMKHYKGLIDEKEEEINSLCRDIRYGFHEVPTLCTLEFNYEKNQKEYVSVDTGEVIKTEAIQSEMDSLFQKPLEEGEWPESEEIGREDIEDTEDDGYKQFLAQETMAQGSYEDADGNEGNSQSAMNLMEFSTDEAMSSELPAIQKWGDILKKEAVNDQQ